MISSIVIPDANNSNRLSTGYRSPRTAGLPCQIEGSSVIRSSLDTAVSLSLLHPVAGRMTPARPCPYRTVTLELVRRSVKSLAP